MSLSSTSTPYVPVRVMEIELTAPIPAITPIPALNHPTYGDAHILIRIHNQPLGLLKTPLDNGALDAQALSERIWSEFSVQINAHLIEDGLPAIDHLPMTGIPAAAAPTCLAATAKVLANQPFVSVVIPTHDRADMLRKCVDSILRQTYSNYELIIVDDAPSDNSTWELYQREYAANAKVRYTREHRPSPSWARNHGLNIARAPYAAFIDDDVILDQHWLASVMQSFVTGQDVACVTTLLLPVELETQAQFWFEQYGGFNKGYTPHVYDLQENRPKSPLFPYAAGLLGTGGAFAFRTEWMRRIGGCDPDLKAGEDLSIFFEAIMSGHQLAYQPAAIGWHHHRHTYEHLRKQIYSYGWGLSAFVTRSIVRDPRRLFGLLWRLPRGLAYMFSPKSAKNQRKQNDYPAELTALERRGLLLGPYVYFKQRWANRKLYNQKPPEAFNQPTLQNS